MKYLSTYEQMRRAAFWGCALAILILSLMPPVPKMPTTGWDKSNHMLAFAVLMLLGRCAYPGRMAFLACGLLAYGALIELLQSLTPARFAEWGDLLADALGLIAGWALGQMMAWLIARRLASRSSDE
ncbi:putative integral membrane protein [Variovorax sp. PBL-H6]|uniref:VanZ family protein n=1 Tax=Variovorax sp. PBL-H6 TaxID=434009 RepID=UPI0013189FF4|nr:VanZ family protein [Variovorax sp. PBL-H6]VTU38637.1 putative integral membrane protein [Variovorax sp. PBL-H6]